MKKSQFIHISTLLLLLFGLVSAQEWTELKRPGNEKGLFLGPRLLSMGSKIHMVWSGTNDAIRKPEVMHSHIDGGDSKWKSPRAPFFGRNKSRVRKVAIGKTRNMIGIFFQRSMTQGNNAYEMLLSLSGDQGWSWSNTIEIDQFVAEKTGGTALSVAGRQGSNRPEFALAWSRTYGSVRAANFDLQSSIRPEGTNVGEHTPGAVKVEVGALGKDGFSVMFNNGVGLSKAHVRALIGKIQEGGTFLRGRFGEFFTVASRPFGYSRMAVGSGTTLETMTSKGKKWKKDDQSAQLPFNANGVMVESDVDDKKDMHLAMLRKNAGKYELWYMGQIDKKWGEAELVHSFDASVDMKGFDIAATKKYVIVVGSQGFDAKFFRKKIR